jgi:O-antigen ligase
VAVLATDMQHATAGADKRQTLAFRALVLFSFLYYARPEDAIPPLRLIPMSKIVAVVCVFGLIAGLGRRRKMKFPLALTFLLLLFAQMIISVPFALAWRGLAFWTVVNFAKGVVVAVLIALLVDTLPQLRKLLFVQAAAVSFMAFASLALHHTSSGRLIGAEGGIFENSNDLAINVAVNLPLCFAFFLRAGAGLRKVLWGLPLIAMLAVVLLTYSRSGFLALVIAGIVCLWEFGVKGRRFYLILLAIFTVVLMMAFAPAHYYTRVESIFVGRIKDSQDRGSEEARRELLKTSLQIMGQHPVTGIGPGNFPVFTGKWLVAHNTYSEMGAEVGIPALILFLLVLGAGINNLFVAQKSALFKKNNEFRILTGGLMASMAAYMLGAFFADTAYNLFPYFLVAYTCGLRQIAEHPEATLAVSVPLKPAPAAAVTNAYAGRTTADLVPGPRR